MDLIRSARPGPAGPADDVAPGRLASLAFETEPMRLLIAEDDPLLGEALAFGLK
jgi:hypothetical protein